MTEPLSLPPDVMRRLGYRVVDRIVAHLEGARRPAAGARGRRRRAARAARRPAARGAGRPGRGARAALRRGAAVHPARRPSRASSRASPARATTSRCSPTPPAAGHNVFAGSWTGGSGPATVELVVLDWLRALVRAAGGDRGRAGQRRLGRRTCVALAAARTARLAGGRTRRRSSTCRGGAHRGRPRAARARLRRRAAAPRCRLTSGSACGPPTCARPWRPTARPGGARSASWRRPARRPPARSTRWPSSPTCAPREDLWLHVDGAYGAPAVLTAPGRAALAGLERADSLVLDPHKWLFQPYEIGCVLVREPGLLERTFALDGAVPARHRPAARSTSATARLQLTRGSRALKLWLSIAGVRARRVPRRRSRAGSRWPSTPRPCCARGPGWEVVSPAQLGDRLLPARRRRRAADPRSRPRWPPTASPLPSTTELGGRVALRMCTINPRTTFRGRRGDDRAHGGGRVRYRRAVVRHGGSRP